jgi:hypothetical protein
MRVTWMILWCLPAAAGNCDGRLSDYMNFSSWAVLKFIRIKPNWGELNVDLTGWGYGLPLRAPP